MINSTIERENNGDEPKRSRVENNDDTLKMKDDEIKKLKEENEKLKRELRETKTKKNDYKVLIPFVLYLTDLY